MSILNKGKPGIREAFPMGSKVPLLNDFGEFKKGDMGEVTGWFLDVNPGLSMLFPDMDESERVPLDAVAKKRWKS